MAQEIAQHASDPVEDQIRLMRSSSAFRGLPIATEAEAEAVRAALPALGRPADRRWIASRVVVLLSQYFVIGSAGLAAKVAEGWMRELGDLPAWAIDEACHWWISRHNQHRGRRPLPGDISERALVEMNRVEVARLLVDRMSVPAPRPPDPGEPASVTMGPEGRARVNALAADFVERHRRA